MRLDGSQHAAIHTANFVGIPCYAMLRGEAIKNPQSIARSGFMLLDATGCYWLLVPGGGLEPPHCYQRRILNPLRLPIPPSRPRDTEGMNCRRVQKPRIIPKQTSSRKADRYNRAP